MIKQPRRSLGFLAIVPLLFLGVFAASCSRNERAKNFGGNMTITLPCQQKLVNITWKESEL